MKSTASQENITFRPFGGTSSSAGKQNKIKIEVHLGASPPHFTSCLGIICAICCNVRRIMSMHFFYQTGGKFIPYGLYIIKQRNKVRTGKTQETKKTQKN